MVTVIIPAAGQGNRMRCSNNKIFLPLVDIPMFVHSVLTFSSCSEVDNMIVVVALDEAEQVESILHGFPGLKNWQVVVGGSERQYSIANAIKVVSEKTDVILVHDGARPLLQEECVKDIIQAVRQYKAAVVAVPVKDTIKTVDDNGWVTGTLERRTLWSIQTPQGFDGKLLRQAYNKAEADGYVGTDDASLVERLGVKVKVIPGSYENIKVTTPEDLIIASALLKERESSSQKKGCGRII